jgi:hypothetical protein
MITTNRFNSWLQTHSVLLLVHLLTYGPWVQIPHTKRDTILFCIDLFKLHTYQDLWPNWLQLRWEVYCLHTVAFVTHPEAFHCFRYFERVNRAPHFNILQPFQVRNVGALVLCKLVNVSFYYCPLTQHITNNKAEWAQADQQPLVYKPFLNCDFVQVTWLISAYLKRSLSRKYLC